MNKNKLYFSSKFNYSAIKEIKNKYRVYFIGICIMKLSFLVRWMNQPDSKIEFGEPKIMTNKISDKKLTSMLDCKWFNKNTINNILVQRKQSLDIIFIITFGSIDSSLCNIVKVHVIIKHFIPFHLIFFLILYEWTEGFKKY